ncbi:LuxR C-terminal-related transcriptional regulator [Actinocrispum sp. NPDC049592]|uniref:LuxR C-terminal-related transcriptional regulator n=1 Tax=Actinocrispum sp. NPDC049592 TaxID=3154835 RepID=UPI00341C5C49
MCQVFLPAVPVPGQREAADPDFETVLRDQLGGPAHRLAELNCELARIGIRAPAALPLLLEASQCYLAKHDYLMQKRYAAQAYDCACAWGDPVAKVRAGMALAVASCWTGDLGVVRAHADRAAAYLDGLDDAAIGGLLPELADLSWVEAQLQRLRHAEVRQRRGLAVAEAYEAEDHWILLQVLLGSTLRERGELDEAEAHAEQALEAADLRDSAVHRELALVALGEISLEAGDTERTHRLAEQAGAAADCDTRFGRAGAMLIGMTLIQSGLPRDGRDVVLEAAGGRMLPLIPVASRARVHAALAAADAALGHHAEAMRWSQLAMCTTWTCDQDRTLGYAQLARAEALLGTEPGAALRAAEASRHAFERAGVRLGLAAANRIVGAAQGRLDQPDASASALARAEELYRRSAAPLAAENVRLMRAAAPAPAAEALDDDPAAIECLSPRETQVARLVAQGCSNQQIAGVLDIKLNTVQVHVGRILRKLRVPSRTAVARLVTLAEAGESVAAGWHSSN